MLKRLHIQFIMPVFLFCFKKTKNKQKKHCTGISCLQHTGTQGASLLPTATASHLRQSMQQSQRISSVLLLICLRPSQHARRAAPKLLPKTSKVFLDAAARRIRAMGQEGRRTDQRAKATAQTAPLSSQMIWIFIGIREDARAGS